MSYQINFGNLTAAKSTAAPRKTRSFRIAVLGDFSGRANRGELEGGEALAARKPLKVDVDNLDEIIERLELKVALPIGNGAIEIEFKSIDDFHPDQLYGNVPIFSELSGMRQRVKTASTFAKAAKELQAWGAEFEPAPAAVRAPARGSMIPADGKLTDFARLVGQPSAAPENETPVEELLKHLVAPHIVPAKDPRQDALLSAVDQALAGIMREILHHPDFQAMESLWRSVDFLVRRLETDVNLQIVLLDISAEEFVADISREDDLASSAMYQLLVEQPAQDAHQGPYSLIVANYVFEHTPPHAEVLARVAKVAAQAQAPFVAAISANCIDVKAAEVHPLTEEAWDALKAAPESEYVTLTVPRFMLRHPYGEKTEPIDSFDFEEFTSQSGLRGMLWGNSAILAGCLLGMNFSRDGAKMTARGILGIGDLPFHYYTDKDGDQIALPCTERLLTTRTAGALQARGFTPVLAIKGSPEIRLGGFASLGGVDLAGWWRPAVARKAVEAAPVEDAAPAEEPAPEAPAEEIAADAAAPAEEAPAAEPAAEVSELDALLASVENAVTEEAPAAEAPTATEGESSDSSELDALLAGFATEETATPEGGVDPDLEKLLGDL